MTDEYQYRERQVDPRPEREFAIGNGRISGYASLFLGGMSLLCVLAYLFPSYLTTTELRAAYDAEFLQVALKYGMYFSLFFGVMTFILGKRQIKGAIGIALTLTAFGLGGYMVPIGPVEPKALSLGIDWMILAFLGSTIIFTTLEKLFPKYRDQVILRSEWGLDLFYFVFNHLIVSVVLLVGNFVSTLFDWAVSSNLQDAIQSQPILVQALILLICADFFFTGNIEFFMKHQNYGESTQYIIR